ncbi:sensor histidine kinase [Schumannella luteola]
MTDATPAPPPATAPAPAVPAAPVERRGYGALWRTTLRELLYLLIAFPIALAGFGVTVGLFSAGVGTLITIVIGLVLIIAALYVSRGFGAVDLALLEFAGRPRIPRPDWLDDRARTGFTGWLRASLGNGHYWLYLLHVMLVDFIVATITWSITITWISVALGGLTGWIWGLLFPGGGDEWFFSEWLADANGWAAPENPWLVDTIVFFVLGAVFLALLPFVTRGLTQLHWLIARGMLGAWRSDALEREVRTLAESRGAAISAEGQSLRRLERDIHDGPQQRLVRLQMDLAAAERQLVADPEKAKALISEARQQSKDALEELRALSRGFAPPILLDRGLVAALESAAVRNPIPTRLIDELAPGTALPQEIERNAYFVASEALANAVKHSGATDIELRVSLSDDGRWLDVFVADNGDGGAQSVAGHGLAGLEERLRGLGGTLSVSSPVGGPTLVSARLPL